MKFATTTTNTTTANTLNKTFNETLTELQSHHSKSCNDQIKHYAVAFKHGDVGWLEKVGYCMQLRHN